MSDYLAMRDLRKSLAVNSLTVRCEYLAASGYLPGRQEEQLRQLIADVRVAFGPDIPDRGTMPADNVIPLRKSDRDLIQALNIVSLEML